MPHRLIMYDALRSLAAGNLLTKAGGLSLGMHLANVPEVAIIFDRLWREGFLKQVPPFRAGRDALQYFTISNRGLEALQSGRDWYRRLPFPLRIWGRLGLPLPR